MFEWFYACCDSFKCQFVCRKNRMSFIAKLIWVSLNSKSCSEFIISIILFASMYLVPDHSACMFAVPMSCLLCLLNTIHTCIMPGKFILFLFLLFQVLEVLKRCITSTSCSDKLDEVILDRIFCDSSIHNTLFQIVCTTPQMLEVGFLYLLI